MSSSRHVPRLTLEHRIVVFLALSFFSGSFVSATCVRWFNPYTVVGRCWLGIVNQATTVWQPRHRKYVSIVTQSVKCRLVCCNLHYPYHWYLDFLSISSTDFNYHSSSKTNSYPSLNSRGIIASYTLYLLKKLKMDKRKIMILIVWFWFRREILIV